VESGDVVAKVEFRHQHLRNHRPRTPHSATPQHLWAPAPAPTPATLRAARPNRVCTATPGFPSRHSLKRQESRPSSGRGPCCKRHLRAGALSLATLQSPTYRPPGCHLHVLRGADASFFVPVRCVGPALGMPFVHTCVRASGLAVPCLFENDEDGAPRSSDAAVGLWRRSCPRQLQRGRLDDQGGNRGVRRVL